MPTDIPRILECQNCSHFWCYKCAYIQYFKDVKTPPYLALKFCVNCAKPFDIPGVQILLAVLAWSDKIWKRPKRHISWRKLFLMHICYPKIVLRCKYCSAIWCQFCALKAYFARLNRNRVISHIRCTNCRRSFDTAAQRRLFSIQILGRCARFLIPEAHPR